MYKICHILLFRLKQMLKVPATIVMLFVMPIVFSLIFGSFTMESGQAPPKIALIVEECEICTELGELLINNEQYDWHVTSEEEARKLVADREVLAAIAVEAAAYELLLAEESPYRVIVNQQTDAYIALAQFIQGLSNTIYSQFVNTAELGEEGLLAVLELMNSKPYIGLSEISYQTYLLSDAEASEAVAKSSKAIGFSIMFLLFTLGSAALVIHTERDDYTWQRLRTTAVTFPEILGGYIGSFWLLGWLQFAVMIVFMKLVYGVTWGIYLIPFVSLLIFMIVAYSMMMATLFKSQKQADAINAILVVSTCMLGGVYWPLEIVPDAMQLIAYIIPQYWMMQGMEYVMLNQLDWAVMWRPWVVLAGFSLIFLVIALRKLTKEQ